MTREEIMRRIMEAAAQLEPEEVLEVIEEYEEKRLRKTIHASE